MTKKFSLNLNAKTTYYVRPDYREIDAHGNIPSPSNYDKTPSKKI